SNCFFFQAEDGIRDRNVTGVQTCALPIYRGGDRQNRSRHPLRSSRRGAIATGGADRCSGSSAGGRRGPRTRGGRGTDPGAGRGEIGRASCRERVEVWGGGGMMKRARSGGT